MTKSYEEIQCEGLQIFHFKTINLLNLGAGRGVGGNRNASVVVLVYTNYQLKNCVVQ